MSELVFHKNCWYCAECYEDKHGRLHVAGSTPSDTLTLLPHDRCAECGKDISQSGQATT